ncbi:proton-conducting transporter transmembrane domain-containing protein [Streptacidiphilus rugosus]|uniref:proton-conducting transporter transmembrane domain-containing protein n=1 Tax=Streptacidiphilus rugosus TaxID=405783 RepID=UPI00055AE01C|nr:proton-conducting transporter membrane subunit [Streptacidiphilus rugosus]
MPSSDSLLLVLPVATPLACAAFYALPLPYRRRFGDWAGIITPAVTLTCAVLLVPRVTVHGPVRAAGHLLRADALTVWLLLVVGAVALIAVAASPTYLAAERTAERASERTARRYCLLVQGFLAAMTLGVLAENLGILWVAIEATTIVTAFLVGHRRTRTSVEAAWKYVVICSVGIALAFLGTVLIYYAARHAGLSEAAALDWPTLAANASRLDPDVTRIGIGLIVIGFGAKAGLIPLHAWLPDAHSQAPAPVSALMSGVLLSVAFSALLRYKTICDAALGPHYLRLLLTIAALLTLALAAAILLGQRDYKRMLAYSSMEHMSLIALGTAIGSRLAIAAVLLHIAGHGLAKSVAFCSAGQILAWQQTSRIGRLRALLVRAPGLGAAFGLAVIALLGMPPFSLFASEIAITRAGFTAAMGWPVTAALLLVLAAFAALAARTARMLLGTPQPGPGAATLPHRIGATAGFPLLAGLLACTALGVSTGPLTHLLDTAAALIGGH